VNASQSQPGLGGFRIWRFLPGGFSHTLTTLSFFWLTRLEQAVLLQNPAEGQAVGSQRVRLAWAMSFSAVFGSRTD